MISAANGFTVPELARELRRPVVDVLRGIVDLHIRPGSRVGGVAFYPRDAAAKLRAHFATRTPATPMTEYRSRNPLPAPWKINA